MEGDYRVKMNRRDVISAALHRDDDESCILMGILNITPDSFHAASRQTSHEKAIESGLRMWSQGATWLDVGGESTRPNADFVSQQVELDRVIPVVIGLRQANPDGLISIDTRRPEVARQAIAAGADMVNDVSGLRDPEMVNVVLESGCAVCIMHMQGEPNNMQSNPTYQNCSQEVSDNLKEIANALVMAGHPAQLICLDPGIGFGKTLQHNVELLQQHELFRGINNYSILWGVSRKSMISQLTGKTKTDDRLSGTLAVAAFANEEGIDILRVHDIEEHVDLLNVLNIL
jgi:dihydropteroate synthase